MSTDTAGAGPGVVPERGIVETLRWAAARARDRLDLVAVYVVIALVIGLAGAWSALQAMPGPGGEPPDPPSVGLLLGVALLGLVGAVASLVIQAMFFQAADDALRGVRRSAGELASAVGWRALVLLLVGIIYSIVVAIGLILLILPGIFLALKFSLAFPAAVVDREGPVGSFAASWNATEGRLLRILGFVLLYFVVSIALGIVLGIPLVVLALVAPSLGFVANQLASTLAGALVATVFIFAWVHVYREARPA